MNQIWWYLTRATGIVATVLAVAALVWGFFFSARNTGKHLRPAWWLDLHNWLGGSALAFTAAHMLFVYFDNTGYGLADLFIPGASTVAITWGVVATYLFAITVFTSWPKKRLPRRVWRVVHLSSVIGVALAGVHAYQAGADAKTTAFLAGLVVCSAFAVYATSLRILSLTRRPANSQLAPMSDQSGTQADMVQSSHDHHDHRPSAD